MLIAAIFFPHYSGFGIGSTHKNIPTFTDGGGINETKMAPAVAVAI